MGGGVGRVLSARGEATKIFALVLVDIHGNGGKRHTDGHFAIVYLGFCIESTVQLNLVIFFLMFGRKAALLEVVPNPGVLSVSPTLNLLFNC